jgi:hypothetical protein
MRVTRIGLRRSDRIVSMVIEISLPAGIVQMSLYPVAANDPTLMHGRRRR